MDPVIASRPVVQGGSEHDHACMATAEQKWAARARRSPREAMAPELVAASRAKPAEEASPELPEDIAAGEYGGDADLLVTRKIRSALMAEPGLSFEAKNIKILTLDGRVTLRGRVKSAEEQEILERIANGIAGSNNVNLKL
jgi:osmotically-inducible protein OsmY